MMDDFKSNVLDGLGRNGDVIYQVSLLQGLAYGDYDGSVAVGELKQHGNIGIGTFHRLNGEMILLDGEVYRAAGDGSVEVVSDDETVPFGVVTLMRADESRNLGEILNCDALYAEMDKMVQEWGKNRFYMIRIDGMFQKVNVRSVYAQKEPYKRLVEAFAHDQTVFEYENVEGTAVGLYCPPYMSALNAVGWHLHFISKDKAKGGHVLGLHIADAVLSWHAVDAFQVRLPQNQRFSAFDLTVDQSEDIEKIEKNT